MQGAHINSHCFASQEHFQSENLIKSTRAAVKLQYVAKVSEWDSKLVSSITQILLVSILYTYIRHICCRC